MELDDPPAPAAGVDICRMLHHYDELYFGGTLAGCVVRWTTEASSRARFPMGKSCEIHLSKSLLKNNSDSTLKNTLLHEMIHAYIHAKESNRDRSKHGPFFHCMMESINSSSIRDQLRPPIGYSITVHHDCDSDGEDEYHQWTCKSCGDVIRRTTNRAPTPNDCIQSTNRNGGCNSNICHWHAHKRECGGDYTKFAEPSETKTKRAKGISRQVFGRSTTQKPTLSDEAAERAKSPELGLEPARREPHDIRSPKRPRIKTWIAGQPLPSSRKWKSSTQSGKLAEKNTDSSSPKSLKQSAAAHGGKKEMDYEYRQNRESSQHLVPSSSRCIPLPRKRPAAHVEYSTAIAWLGYYSIEEEEEPIQPLVNKRSVRRRQEAGILNLAVEHESLDPPETSGLRSTGGEASAGTLICISDSE